MLQENYRCIVFGLLADSKDIQDIAILGGDSMTLERKAVAADNVFE